jgi:hypothetical protein
VSQSVLESLADHRVQQRNLVRFNVRALVTEHARDQRNTAYVAYVCDYALQAGCECKQESERVRRGISLPGVSDPPSSMLRVVGRPQDNVVHITIFLCQRDDSPVSVLFQRVETCSLQRLEVEVSESMLQARLTEQ